MDFFFIEDGNPVYGNLHTYEPGESVQIPMIGSVLELSPPSLGVAIVQSIGERISVAPLGSGRERYITLYVKRDSRFRRLPLNPNE